MNNIAFSTIIVLTSFVFSSSAESKFSREQRKHDVRTEYWSFIGKVKTSPKNTSYLAFFLYSGRIMFLSGNFIQLCRFNSDSGSYNHFTGILLPPNSKVQHSTTKLDEQFGDLHMRAIDSGTIDITSDLDLARGKFLLSVQKPPIRFKDVYDSDMKKSKFDWYIFPRVKIEMNSAKNGEIQGEGSGYFQQFWGSKAGQYSDWVVIQLDSGHDFFIAVFPPGTSQPWLPSSYCMICYPDGSRRKIEKFKFQPIGWWNRGRKSFPVKLHITVPNESIDITVEAFRKDQLVLASGRESWCGFGNVKANIGDNEENGWAYFSPMPEMRAEK